MKITMKTAILQGKDFEFNGIVFKNTKDGYKHNSTIISNLEWVLENQDKLVEVEDNYWDSDGRAIRELEDGMEYWYLVDAGDFNSDLYQPDKKGFKQDFLLGNCFKDPDSIRKEITRLKELQKKRMEAVK